MYDKEQKLQYELRLEPGKPLLFGRKTTTGRHHGRRPAEGRHGEGRRGERLWVTTRPT